MHKKPKTGRVTDIKYQTQALANTIPDIVPSEPDGVIAELSSSSNINISREKKIPILPSDRFVTLVN